MQVLILDGDPSIDQSVLRHLQTRGYATTITSTPAEMLDHIQRIETDCILLDVSTTAEGLGLIEIRQLVRMSAVGFMTTTPLEALVAEAVAEGSIEFQSFPVLIENLEYLDQPVLLASANYSRALVLAARDKGLRFSTARTLQFALNLLVDGWCQIVWLHAEIPGVAQADKAAVIHKVGAKQLAILASGQSGSTPGITCTRKPQKASEFTALLRRIADNPSGALRIGRSPRKALPARLRRVLGLIGPRS